MPFSVSDLWKWITLQEIPKALEIFKHQPKWDSQSHELTKGNCLTGSGIQRDVNEGVKWCSLGSRKTIPLAMYYLGLAYSFGDGVTKNQDYASRWIRAAADRGLVSAQYTLGMRLGMGDGMEKNLKHGVLWLRRATQNGSEDAKVQLRRF